MSEPSIHEDAPRVGACAICRSYHRGHHVHFIQLKQANLVPWHWRDAVVEFLECSPDGSRVRARYLAEDHEVTLWHHRDLSRLLQPGDPVVVHERFGLLRFGGTGVSVEVTGGLGPVPEPLDGEPIAVAANPLMAVDVATGHAVGPRLGEPGQRHD